MKISAFAAPLLSDTEISDRPVARMFLAECARLRVNPSWKFRIAEMLHPIELAITANPMRISIPKTAKKIGLYPWSSLPMYRALAEQNPDYNNV